MLSSLLNYQSYPAVLITPFSLLKSPISLLLSLSLATALFSADSGNDNLAQRERALAEKERLLEVQKIEVEHLKSQLSEELERLRHQQALKVINAIRGPIPTVRADRMIIVDAKTGDILLEKNADKRGQVASTQKLLTSLIISESNNLEDYLTVEPGDIDCAPVRIGLQPGDKYQRIQLLTALLVKSSNDIAQALARDNAGSIEAFVDKMNKRAAALGMVDSHFVNPHGLPDDNQYSTARDMARLALADDASPIIRDIIDIRYFDFTKADGKILRLENTNHVLRSYPPCDGMKTGYTQLAGHCLICSGEKDGRRRIVVVLNDNDSVWKDAEALLAWSLKA